MGRLVVGSGSACAALLAACNMLSGADSLTAEPDAPNNRSERSSALRLERHQRDERRQRDERQLRHVHATA